MKEPNRIKKIAIGAIVAVIIVIIVYMLFFTASGKRFIKTTFSDWSGGLNRTITVYDYNGKPVKQYSGKIDIEYEDDRILFDDETGKRHQIVGGITIVDEVD